MTKAGNRSGRALTVRAVLGHVALAARCRALAAARRPRPPWRGEGTVRAVFLPVTPPGHYGTVYRMSRWTPHLLAHGVRADILCPLSDGDFESPRRYLLEPLRRWPARLAAATAADVVFLHRGLFPFSPWQRPTFERLLARENPRIIYDFYDSIWVGRRRARAAARSAAARWLNPPDLVESLIRLASAVTVSNGFLAEFARQHHRDVRVLPMVVEPADYEAKEHRKTEETVLGWMGGGDNASRLLALAPVLRETARRAHLRLRTVGPRPIGIPGVRVESSTHPWSAASEREDLAGIDVGLLPLFDDDVDRGKSPLKLLQFAAAGLPVVASPVAVDASRFVDGESILLARTDAEWVAAILSLAADPARRAELGAGARAVVAAHYSFSAHAAAFAALLRDVAGRGA